MSKFIGDVSAYAYAVSKGYTGTEEEYAELMASYATVGQTAVTAAQTATTKASEAATSATTATNKASEATTAATTATTKAGEASTSASTATSAKDTAVSASQTATTKATEATTAAETATTAKNDAVTAKTAAETAQGKAETAQGAAEEAAESVSASAAQIATNASDISELKSDLSDVNAELADVRVGANGTTYASAGAAVRGQINELKSDGERRIGKIDILNLFELGNIDIKNTGWTYFQSKQRVRTKVGTTLHLFPGDIVGLSNYTNARYYTGYKKLDGSYGLYPWRVTDLHIEYEGDYVFILGNLTDTDQTGKESLASLFFGYTGIAFDSIMDNATNIENLKILHSPLTTGFLSVDGNVSNYDNAVYKTVTTDFIPVEVNDRFSIDFSFNSSKNMWLACGYFDEKKNLTGARTVIIPNVDYTSGSANITVSNANAKYIRISYRTYGEININIVANNTVKINSKRIDNVINEMVIGRAELNKNVKSINHRGYDSFPENTLPAFIESRKQGFNIVETDVRFTSDGVPVLLHDDSINRTARNADGSEITGTVNIADITYAQSQEYDFGIYKSSQFAGIKIPKFEDFLKLCKSLGLGCYIELKIGTQAQIESLVDMVKSCGMENSATWISGSFSMLTIVKTRNTRARLGAIATTFTTDNVNSIQDLKTGENDVFADLYIYASDIANQISLAKQNSISVEVWTVVNAVTIPAVDPYVTGITTDNFVAGYVLFENAMKN